MNRRTKIILAASAGGAVIALGAAGVAVAAGAGDDEPLRGATKDRAVAAALAETGGGTVTETEAGDDGAAYEVEVRLADGREVEVRLDQDFTVIGTEADDDSGSETNDSDDK
jgi:hypothetical protein